MPELAPGTAFADFLQHVAARPSDPVIEECYAFDSLTTKEEVIGICKNLQEVLGPVYTLSLMWVEAETPDGEAVLLPPSGIIRAEKPKNAYLLPEGTIKEYLH